MYCLYESISPFRFVQVGTPDTALSRRTSVLSQSRDTIADEVTLQDFDFFDDVCAQMLTMPTSTHAAVTTFRIIATAVEARLGPVDPCPETRGRRCCRNPAPRDDALP